MSLTFRRRDITRTYSSVRRLRYACDYEVRQRRLINCKRYISRTINLSRRVCRLNRFARIVASLAYPKRKCLYADYSTLRASLTFLIASWEPIAFIYFVRFRAERSENARFLLLSNRIFTNEKLLGHREQLKIDRFVFRLFSRAIEIVRIFSISRNRRNDAIKRKNLNFTVKINYKIYTRYSN